MSGQIRASSPNSTAATPRSTTAHQYRVRVSDMCVLPSGSGQVFVDHSYGHRALADGGGDPLDRSTPDIAHGQNTGAARFQVRGRPTAPGVTRRVRTGTDVATRVESHLAA